MSDITFPYPPEFQHTSQAPAGAAPAPVMVSAPVVMAPQGVEHLPAPVQTEQAALVAAEPAVDPVSAALVLEATVEHQDNSFLSTPRTMEGAQKLAEYLAPSNIVPAAIRNRPADVFCVLARAASVGLNWSQAFSSIHIIPNPKNGDVTLSMSVAAKAAICIQYGHWDVTVDMQQGRAVARGTRYGHGARPEQHMEVEYTAYEASLMGRMGRDENSGVFYGLKTWESRWPQMLKVRALGRLLDALFPDKIGGFVNKEELEDEAERAIASADKAPKARRTSRPKATPQQTTALTSLEDCLIDDEAEATTESI